MESSACCTVHKTCCDIHFWTRTAWSLMWIRRKKLPGVAYHCQACVFLLHADKLQAHHLNEDQER